jgi:hypothetical protein
MDKTKMKEENELHIQSQKQENFSDIPSDNASAPPKRGGGMMMLPLGRAKASAEILMAYGESQA